MRRSYLLGALVPALALLIAGCGGGGGETTETTAAAPVTTAPTLTKADLLKQGDGICAEVNAAIGSLSSSASEGASQVAQEAELYKGMVERLKDLGMPEEAEGYEQFIAAADELAQAQSNASLAAARGETESLETAETEASTALSSFQSAAEEYGFENCSEAPSAPTPSSGSGTQAPSAGAEPEAGGVEEGPVEEEAEAAPEAVEEAPAPETETGGAGGAGSTEAGGGGTAGGGEAGGGSSSGGIGPG